MKHIRFFNGQVLSALFKLEGILSDESGFEIDFFNNTREFESELVERLGRALDKGDIVVTKYRDFCKMSTRFSRNEYVVGRDIQALEAYERWNESSEALEASKRYDHNGACYSWREPSKPLRENPFSDGEAFKRDYSTPNQFNDLPHIITFVVTGNDGEVIVEDNGSPVGLPSIWRTGLNGYEQIEPEYDECDCWVDEQLMQIAREKCRLDCKNIGEGVDR